MRGVAMAEEPGEVVAKMRFGIYRDLYRRGHGINTVSDIPIEDGVVVASDQLNGPVKPYIPPTELTDNEALPYGNVVGAPLGF